MYNIDVLVFTNLHLAFGVFNILNNSMQEVGLPTLVINFIFFCSLRLFFLFITTPPPPNHPKKSMLTLNAKESLQNTY